MTNAGVSPRSSVRFSNRATRGAVTRPIAYMANIVTPGTHQPWPAVSHAPISTMYTGSRREPLQHAVDQETCERAGWQSVAQGIAAQVLAGADDLHERAGPGENRLEDDEHHDQEDQRAPNAMRQDAIEPVGPGDGSLRRALH